MILLGMNIACFPDGNTRLGTVILTMINAANNTISLIYKQTQSGGLDVSGKVQQDTKTDNSSSSSENNARISAVDSAKSGSGNALTYDTFSALLEAQELMATQKVDDVKKEEKVVSQGVEDFREFMEMTPEERYIAQALAQKGYTQEEFDALPPEEQQKLLEEIREEYRQKLEEEAKAGEVGQPPE